MGRIQSWNDPASCPRKGPVWVRTESGETILALSAVANRFQCAHSGRYYVGAIKGWTEVKAPQFVPPGVATK